MLCYEHLSPGHQFVLWAGGRTGDTSRCRGARQQPVTPITSAVIPVDLYATNVGCVVNVRHLLYLYMYSLLCCAVL